MGLRLPLDTDFGSAVPVSSKRAPIPHSTPMAQRPAEIVLKSRRPRAGEAAKVKVDRTWLSRIPVEPCEVYIVVPVKTINGTNAREHWTTRKRRTESEHAAVNLCLFAHDLKREELAKGCTVTLTRISVGKMDGDNLQGAMKGIRDAIAAWMFGGKIGQNDSSPLVEWKYDQKTLGKGKWGVIVAMRGNT